MPPESPPPAPADGRDRPLDPRVIPLQQLVGWMVAAFLAGAFFFTLLILWVASGQGWPVLAVLVVLWVLASGLLGWRAHRWPAIAYRHASYRVDGQGIEIRRGVLWRKVISVPRSRVQHTDVSQGPLERNYGLGTLVIYTAGTDFARIDLAGLDHGVALRIRSHLLPREGSDAV